MRLTVSRVGELDPSIRPVLLLRIPSEFLIGGLFASTICDGVDVQILKW